MWHNYKNENPLGKYIILLKYENVNSLAQENVPQILQKAERNYWTWIPNIFIAHIFKAIRVEVNLQKCKLDRTDFYSEQI